MPPPPSPSSLPSRLGHGLKRGWKIARAVGVEFRQDQVTILAGALAFYGLLALFPALIALISIYGLVFDPAHVEQQLGPFVRTLPDDAAQLLRDRMDALVRHPPGALRVGLLVSLAATFVSASNGIFVLIKGINAAFFEKETRSFLRLRLTALGWTLAMIGFLVLALAAFAVLPAVLALLNLSAAMAVLTWARWPVFATLLAVGLAALYRRAPDRSHRPPRRWVSPGSIGATGLWLAVSWGFSFYTEQFGRFDETYGSLGAVVALLLWLWLGAMSVLLGAELDAVLELHTEEPSEPEPDDDDGEPARRRPRTEPVRRPWLTPHGWV